MSVIEHDKFRDGMIFRDKKDPEDYIVVNYATFIEVLKAIMVKYANKNFDEASDIISKSKILSEPINSYNEALMFCHDLEYHWAMLLAYGNGYWHNEGISETPPTGYFEWEDEYRREHNLAPSSFEFP